MDCKEKQEAMHSKENSHSAQKFSKAITVSIYMQDYIYYQCTQHLPAYGSNMVIKLMVDQARTHNNYNHFTKHQVLS